MDVKQRFLRRLFLIENTDMFLRESRYHKNHDDMEDIPGTIIWRWDEEEGASEDPIR